MSTDVRDMSMDTVVPFDLDKEIAAAKRSKQQREQEAKRERQAQVQQEQDNAVAELRELIRLHPIFPEEFAKQVNLRYGFGRVRSTTRDVAYAALDYQGEWRIAYDGRNVQSEDLFTITRPDGSGCYETRDHWTTGSELVPQLLLEFAAWREQQEQSAQWERELERQRAEAVRQEDAEKLARKADNDACEQEIAAAKAAAEAEMWHWPEGVSITLYHTRWQDGRDSDGDPSYDEGWSQYDGPDSFGYITLLPNGKRIRLIAEAHLPVVEEVTISEAKQLPSSLRHAKAITLEGIRYYYGSYGNEPHYRHEEGERITVHVGYEPVEAVRNIIEEVTSGIPF